MEDLEELSLRQSAAKFRSAKGEVTANFGLLLADAMIYAIGFISFLLAIVGIANGVNPTEWDYQGGDLMLLMTGLLLWLCSQSLNDFKRLLPLWLRMALRLGIGPKDFADQSHGARLRRAYTLVLASLLSAVAGWRISLFNEGITTRSGLEFHLVIYAVAGGLLLLAVHWLRLIGREDELEQFA